MENRPRSRDHSPVPEDADYHERWIQQALAGLQLPHMPQSHLQPEALAEQQRPSSPSIRILLVSDVDLPSASALAEYTLLQNNEVFDASRIDLCIACGPFCRDEDLLPYLKGKQKKHLQHLFEGDRKYGGNGSNQHGTNNQHKRGTRSSWSSVFFRSQEETAAMEGLVTAAISQLESIVCRVVFCPGSTDPISTSTSSADLRFTPNSRNIHRQWLPLAPGLGCAGLLFLDAPSGVLQVKAPPGRRANQQLDYDSDEEVDGDCQYDHHHHRHHHQPRGQSATLKLTKVHGNDAMGAQNYCKALERLVQLAPPPQKNYPFATKLSQTILVTHYFQPSSREDRGEGEDSDDDEKDNDLHIHGYGGEEDTGESDADDAVASTAEVSQDQRSEASINRAASDEDANDDNNAVRSKPDDGPSAWSPEYRRFVESSVAQENLALEIASGGGVAQRPKEMQKGNVRIVIPGSLRERGEFCLVDMSLMEQAAKKNFTTAASAPSAAKKKSTFAWRVRSVEFHNMERLP